MKIWVAITATLVLLGVGTHLFFDEDIGEFLVGLSVFSLAAQVVAVIWHWALR